MITYPALEKHIPAEKEAGRYSRIIDCYYIISYVIVNL